MQRIKILQKLGVWMFALMWIPFTCIFVGIIGEEGGWGADFARWVDQLLPGLLMGRGSGLSILATVSMTLTFTMSIVSMLLIFGTPFLSSRLNKRILQTGRAATAEILSVENTGTYINDAPVVRFGLEVRPQGETPFTSETERLLSFARLSALQPGTIIPVRYDPETLDVAMEE